MKKQDRHTKLTFSKETIRLLGPVIDLRLVNGATCWETVAAPCNENNNSATGCVSGNLC